MTPSGNQILGAGVQPCMDELWDIAQWQAEIDQHFLDQGVEPP